MSVVGDFYPAALLILKQCPFPIWFSDSLHFNTHLHVPVAPYFFEKRAIFSKQVNYPIVEIGIFEVGIDLAPLVARRNTVASLEGDASKN